MSTSTISLKEALFILSLLSLAMIAPPLNTPIGVYGDPQILFPLLMVLFFFSLLSRSTLAIYPFKQTALLLVATILLATISMIIEGEGNLYGTMRLGKALVMFLGIACFITFIRDKYDVAIFRESFPFWIYLVISANGLVMLGQFYLPRLSELIREFTLAGAFTTITWDPSGAYRMSGLSLSGGAQVSLFQSIGVLLFPVLVVTERSIARILICTVLFFVNCFSVMISGRSGFYNVAVIFPLICVLFIWDSRFFNFSFVWKRIFVLFCIMFSVAGFVIYAVRSPEEIAMRYSPALASAITRNLDFLSDNTGFIRNETTEVLWYNHIILPSDLRTWLVGAPEVMEDRGITRTLDSDMGYIVSLNSFGIFNSFLQLLVNLIPCYFALRYRRHALRLGYAAMIVTASVLFFNAKEVMFFTRMAWPLQMIIWCAFVYSLEDTRRDWWEKARGQLKTAPQRANLLNLQ